MNARRIAAGAALLIGGLIAAVGIGLLANTISGDSVGLSAEPLRAGDTLAPLAADEARQAARDRRRAERRRAERARRRAAARAERARQQAAPPPADQAPTAPVSPDDNGGGFEPDDDDGSGQGRGRGRSGEDSGGDDSGGDDSGGDDSGGGSDDFDDD